MLPQCRCCDLEKNRKVEFNELFSSDRMDETNLWNPKFFEGLISPYGVLDIQRVVTPKRHTSECTLSIGTIGLVQIFSCRLFAENWKPPFMTSAPNTLEEEFY